MWVAEPAACGEACLPCDEGFDCELGSVCVRDELGALTYQCAPNPCGDEPDCACYEPLCAQNFMTCVGFQTPAYVFCGGVRGVR